VTELLGIKIPSTKNQITKIQNSNHLIPEGFCLRRGYNAGSPYGVCWVFPTLVNMASIAHQL
jgi:hypothetical protein